MKNLLVSIIIPVYNVQDYLNECISSVLEQSYHNIEVLLINDGSSDNSGDIISRFADKDDRIIFIDKVNTGVGASRNIGLEKASGDYVLFIDSDDYVDVYLVERLLKSIDLDDICIYDAVSFESTTKVFSEEKYLKGLSNELLQAAISSNTYKEYLFFYISPCLKLYKRELLVNNNISFPEGTYGEDVPFWLNCLLVTTKIKYIDYIGYYRRFRSQSIMTAGSIKNLKDRVDSISDLFDLAKDNRGLQIKILIYALDSWFSVYDLDNKDLLQHTSKVYKQISLVDKVKKIKPPIDLRLRYFLCNHTNAYVIKVYRFLFYTIYSKFK